MKRLIVIASGSKNNAALIENDGKTILIDCGVSLRSLNNVYKDFSLDIKDLLAVFVTHSHTDHTKYLATLQKKLDVPFYSGANVADVEKITDTVCLDGFEVSPFELSHDVDCCGYKIDLSGTLFGFATDTGVITKTLLDNLENCETVMLESNHDVDMLRFGPYTQSLKNRILSEHGHLSNADCAKTAVYLAQRKLEKIVLAHLSETNNSPLVAKRETFSLLQKYGFDNVEIEVAEHYLEVLL